MFRDPASSTFRNILVASVIGVGVFLIPNGAQSATSDSATIQWATNQESDVAGYRVYRGTTSGVYGGPQNAGTTTTYQYDNLESNKTHYFSITAYDRSGNESPPSPEVSKAIPGQSSVTEPPSLVSPPLGSTLTSSTMTFQWSAGSGVDEYWLYVGTTPKGKDIYTQSRGTSTSASVAGIPLTGNPVFVRLWWKTGTTWFYTDSTYQTQKEGGTPSLVSPPLGSTLTSSTMTFQWSAGSGVDEYWLYVGTTPKGKDIYTQSRGTSTSASVADIPLTGNPVFVRLWWKTGTTWFYTDSTYQTQKEGGTPSLVSPPLGSTLTSSTMTFQWSAGSGVDEYWLYVGTTPKGKDIYTQSRGTSTSASVADIPLTGNPVFVRLWWKTGTTWFYTDSTYQTQKEGGTPSLVSPPLGSTLTSSTMTFQWSAGSGVDEYWLYVGTTPKGKDIYTQSRGTSTSASVADIPLTGNPVFVRLWWKTGTTWFYTDSTYQTQKEGGTPSLVSPPLGSTLTSSTMTFQWSAGSGVDEYWLYVGTTPKGKDIYTQSRGTSTSASVADIPLTGNPVFVRLWWKTGTTWFYTDSTYQTQ